MGLDLLMLDTTPPRGVSLGSRDQSSLMNATQLTHTDELSQVVECPKCTGQGRFEHFAHIADGVCFLCGGARQIEIRKLMGGKKTLSMVVWKACPTRTGRVPAGYDDAGKTLTAKGQESTVVSISCQGRNGTEWTRSWDLSEQPERADALRSTFRNFIAQGRRVQVNFRSSFFWEREPYAQVWNGSEWDRAYGNYAIMD